MSASVVSPFILPIDTFAEGNVSCRPSYSFICTFTDNVHVPYTLIIIAESFHNKLLSVNETSSCTV